MTSQHSTPTPHSRTTHAPTNPALDVVRVPRYLGLQALTYLAGKEGAVAVDSGDRHLYFLIEHTTLPWDLRHTAVLNAAAVALPPANTEKPPGPYWLTPLHRGRTDTAALHRALQDALACPAPAGEPENPEVRTEAPRENRRTRVEEPRDRPAVSALGQLSMGFAPDPQQLAVVRKRTANALASWGIPAAVDTVVLVVSELAANAIVHTLSTQPELVLTYGEGLLLVEVRDDSTDPPTLVRRTGDPTGGRGLQVVNALSTDWGWSRLHQERKAVWALMPVRGAHLAAQEAAVTA
jgi:anti-sigma regulatory factor (Ser/Thr protein kinase)